MIPFVKISNLKLKGKPEEQLSQLKDAVSKFERHVYSITNPNKNDTDITTLTQQVQALQNVVVGLSANQFPGFGDTYLTAARGSHTHPQNTFFSKKGTQVATAGTNTIPFDSTIAFLTVPVVTAWLVYTDNTWAALNPDTVTIAGFTATVQSIDGSPNIYYIATGS